MRRWGWGCARKPAHMHFFLLCPPFQNNHTATTSQNWLNERENKKVREREKGVQFWILGPLADGKYSASHK